MSLSSTPAIAAAVAKPARSECPAYFFGSRPAFSAALLMIKATDLPDNALDAIFPDLEILRKRGPLSIPLCSSHSLRAITGHVLEKFPYGIAIREPTPS